MQFPDEPLWLLIAGALAVLSAVGVPAGIIAAWRHRRGKRVAAVLVQALVAQLAVWYIAAIVLQQASFRLHVQEVEARQGASNVLLDRSVGPLMLRRVVGWSLGGKSGTSSIDFTWAPLGALAAAGAWTAVSSVLMGATWWALRPSRERRSAETTTAPA